jgi:hypothetical protein
MCCVLRDIRVSCRVTTSHPPFRYRSGERRNPRMYGFGRLLGFPVWNARGEAVRMYVSLRDEMMRRRHLTWRYFHGFGLCWVRGIAFMCILYSHTGFWGRGGEWKHVIWGVEQGRHVMWCDGLRIVASVWWEVLCWTVGRWVLYDMYAYIVSCFAVSQPSPSVYWFLFSNNAWFYSYFILFIYLILLILLIPSLPLVRFPTPDERIGV